MFPGSVLNASRRHKPLAAVLVFLVAINLSVPAWALPGDFTVEQGTVSAERPGPGAEHFHIESDQAILGFGAFDIAPSETVSFHFHNTDAGSVLNRVSSGAGSEIAGFLLSNGQVFLVNPAGIHIAESARIQTAGFVASTLNISNADFLARNYRFKQDPSRLPAAVINDGQILTGPGGLVALLGGGVVNDGLIAADLGKVVLAAGEKVTLGFGPEGQLAVAIDQPLSHVALGPDGKPLSAAVQQNGTLSAPGGYVLVLAKSLPGLFDTLINQDGFIEAKSVASRNGRIELIGKGGLLQQNGIVSADGSSEAPSGGQVFLSGTRIVERGAVTANAGENGQAGEIRVTSIEETTLVSGSRLEAKASGQNGRGGSIRVTSTQPKVSGGVDFQAGSLMDVSGGSAAGDAGFIELSARSVSLQGSLVAVAQEGYEGGHLLVDPLDLTFNNSTPLATPPNSATGTPDTAFDTPDTVTPIAIKIADIKGFAEAFFQAVRDIIVNNKLKMNNNKKLRFEAGRNINLNADVQVQGTGTMTLTADAAFAGFPADGAGTIDQSGGGKILADNAAVTLQTGGDFAVGTITTGTGAGGAVSITSTAGSILKGGKITTRDLTLVANALGKGAGTAGALDTNMNNLSLDVGSGGAAVSDSGSFTMTSATLASGASLNLKAEGNLTAAASAAATGAGTLAFESDSDSSGSGDFTTNGGTALSTANQPIQITAADMTLNGTVSSGTASTTVLVSKVGRTIGLGAGAGNMSISGAELANITSASLIVGDSSNGNITVDGVAGAQSDQLGAVTLNATGANRSVIFSGSDSTFNSLTVNANKNVTVETNLTMATGGFTANADSDANGTGTFTVDAGKTLTTTDKAVQITADNIALTGSITSGAGNVTFLTSTGVAVGLGTGAGNFKLSDAELDRATTTGTLTIGDGTAGVITVDALTQAAKNLALVSGSTINDDDDVGSAVTTTGKLTLTSGGAIGNLGGAAGLNTDVGTLAVTSTGGNNLTVTNAGTSDLTLSSILTGGAGNVKITQSANNLVVGAVSTTGSVDLTATGGSINDDVSDAVADITAGALTLTASGAGKGVGVANGTLDTAASSLTATVGSGGLSLSNTGDLTVTNVASSGGALSLTASGSILDGNGGLLNLTAGAPSSLVAGGIIGTVADPIEVLVTGSTLSVSPSSVLGGVSADLSGTVTPSGTLDILNIPLGQVIFNGVVIFPLPAPPASPASTVPTAATSPFLTPPGFDLALDSFFTQASAFLNEEVRRRRPLP